MANPSGANNLSPNGYGDIKKQTELTKAAPISGAPVSGAALNSPQRSQRRATSGNSSPQPTAVASSQPSPPTPTTEAQVAAIWQTVAAHPQASVLVRQYAERAQGQRG